MGGEQCVYTPIVTLEQHKRPVEHHMWSEGALSSLALFLGVACGARRCGCRYAPEPEPKSSKVKVMTLDAVSVRLYGPDNTKHPISSLSVV